MPRLTAPKASDDIALLIVNLVTDNLNNRNTPQENEDVARSEFNKMLETMKSLSPAVIKKICSSTKTKLTGYGEMTRDIPGAYASLASTNPLLKKAELNQIREQIVRESHEYFDSFSKGTILDIEISSSKSRKGKTKVSGGTRKRKQNNK